MRTNETYKFTECAQKAIDELYPEDMREPLFSNDMKILQAALIRCHFNDMDNTTKVRAIKTLMEIDAFHPHQMGGHK